MERKLFISIVIPVYNAEKTMANCLDSLVKVDYPAYEIIVVDDGSTDNTSRIVAKYNVVYIKQKKSGAAAARNIGINKAKGDVIYFVDSDCIVPQENLRILEKHFKNTNIVGVGGTYRSLNLESLTSRFIDCEISYRHSYHKLVRTFGTYNAAFRKDTLEKKEGFDTSFRWASGEDFDLCFRLKRSGFKLVFDSNFYVWHHHPSTVWQYIKQQLKRGFTRTRNVSRHGKVAVFDEYLESGVQFQPLLILLFFFGILLSPWNHFLIMISLFSLLAIYILSIGLIRFILTRDHKLIPFSLLMIFLRPCVWSLGAMWFIINHVRETATKKKRGSDARAHFV